MFITDCRERSDTANGQELRILVPVGKALLGVRFTHFTPYVSNTDISQLSVLMSPKDGVPPALESSAYLSAVLDRNAPKRQPTTKNNFQGDNRPTALSTFYAV